MSETVNLRCKDKSEINECSVCGLDMTPLIFIGRKIWVVTEQFDSIYHPESPKRIVAVFDTKEKAEDLANQQYPKGFSHYIEEMEIS